ncbi:MAG: putative LysR family transcriptional regulator [Polaromonas sp.]|nr:putative LysR family transcriptional regulator [Polaromonas sp.]
MNLRQLRYFVTAVDLSNITRAAQKLHVAQPALGMHIRELEAELGVSLLRRHSRGVEPTPAGQLLYSRATSIFEQLEEARRDVIQLHNTARQPIALGITTSLMLLIGTDIQLSAQRDFESLALSLVEGPSFFLADAIERDELDVAFAYNIEPRPNLVLTAVMDEEILFVTPFVAGETSGTVSMEEVLASKLALGSRRDIGRRILALAAGLSPENLKVAYEVQSIAAIRELILRGEACSVMPYGSVAHELATGQLLARRISGCPLKSTLYIVRRAGHPLTKTPQFDEALKKLLNRTLDMAVEKIGDYGTRI